MVGPCVFVDVGAARCEGDSCSLGIAAATAAFNSYTILTHISVVAILAAYLTAGCVERESSRWALCVCWILMPVYDPRAREQFRQAALGRPAARGRRASYDSSALTKTIPNKLLSPPASPPSCRYHRCHGRSRPPPSLSSGPRTAAKAPTKLPGSSNMVELQPTQNVRETAPG